MLLKFQLRDAFGGMGCSNAALSLRSRARRGSPHSWIVGASSIGPARGDHASDWSWCTTVPKTGAVRHSIGRAPICRIETLNDQVISLASNWMDALSCLHPEKSMAKLDN